MAFLSPAQHRHSNYSCPPGILRYVVVSIVFLFYSVYVLLSGIIVLYEQLIIIFNEKEIEKYRKLQVTQAYVNLCVRNRIFPSGAYVGPLIQIMASLIFLKYHDTVNLTYLAFVSAIFADAFVLNLVWFGGAGLVYSKSKAWLRKMRMQVGNVNIDMDGIMVTRKLLKSMCPIKVWFGTNFVDELTPLIIQQFCTLQTIDFLLLL